MPTLSRRSVILLLCAWGALICNPVDAQTVKQKKPKVAKVKPEGPYAPGPLFNTDSLLEIKLSGNLKTIFNDRDDEEVQQHPMLLEYTNIEGKSIGLPLKVRTRGHFRRRRENCKMPPLMLDIVRDAKRKTTLFEKQNKLKLVTACLDDEYVVREYLVYKVYNLLSPQCMRARLVKVTYNDSAGKMKINPQYGILLEDDGKAARRSGNFIWDRKFVNMETVNATDFTTMAVFQYLIGNTDWSVPYLHNIKLAFKDSNAIPIAIPYDFDHSGIVSAPYAMPPEQLGLSTVRDRRYRGYCQDMDKFQPAIDRFNKLKDEIYKVYTDCPFSDERYKKFATKYLDDFYKTINNPKAVAREFGYPCVNKERITISGYEN